MARLPPAWSRGIGWPSTLEAKIDLSIDVGPLLGRSQSADQIFELLGGGGRELEPGEEVELFLQIPTVVEATGDGRQVVEPGGDVAGSGLEYRHALLLGEIPPGWGLADRDECAHRFAFEDSQSNGVGERRSGHGLESNDVPVAPFTADES